MKIRLVGAPKDGEVVEWVPLDTLTIMELAAGNRPTPPSKRQVVELRYRRDLEAPEIFRFVGVK